MRKGKFSTGNKVKIVGGKRANKGKIGKVDHILSCDGMYSHRMYAIVENKNHNHIGYYYSYQLKKV